ncbi:MAG: VOC family protein [Acidobacteriaceae bacterium]|nr:VOC family protein [Acidobacteriaceae bacterium]
MATAGQAANMFGPATPIFCVSSVQASIEYYLKALGFKVDWQAGPGFASVSRGRCHIFLCEDGQGHPGTWTWIGVTDADSLAQEYRETGAKIRHPPTNYPWAYEMQVEDPDGNVLRFGSDPKKDEPFGPFMDMHGRLWPPSQESTLLCE